MEENNQILILGGKSDIAISLAEVYAENGYNLVLAGRKINEITTLKIRLEQKYNVTVELQEFDLLHLEKNFSLFENLKGKIYGVISCIGYLGNQKLAEVNSTEANLILNTNFTGCVKVLDKIAVLMKNQGEGFIIGLSSVAGDRGRKSNYYYGSAKAGFTAYLSGLRSRLASYGVHVLTVKPGFVNTKMTSHLDLPKLLTTTPNKVAKSVYRAQQNKQSVLYVKPVWRLIMAIITLIPEFLFKKLNL